MARPKKSVIDGIKTIVWFNFVTQTTGINPNRLQRELNKSTQSGHDSHKCYRWKNGSRTPNKINVAEIEKLAPNASWQFYHPLWDILKNPSAIVTLVDIERLLFQLPYPELILFKRADGDQDKLVRVSRPLDLSAADALRYNNTFFQYFFVQEYENLDLMAAYFILAREAQILGSHSGLVIALTLYEESKPLIEKIPELKGVTELLFKFIENSSEWNYPEPEEKLYRDVLMKKIQLVSDKYVNPPDQ